MPHFSSCVWTQISIHEEAAKRIPNVRVLPQISNPAPEVRKAVSAGKGGCLWRNLLFRILPVPLSVLLRCKTGAAFKDFGEVTLVVEAGCDRDIENRVIGIGQQSLTFFDPDKRKIFFK